MRRIDHEMRSRPRLFVAALVAAGALTVSMTARAQTAGVFAQSGSYTVTQQDFEDIHVIDASVLDTPLSVAEEAQARQNILSQFQKSPAAFTKALPETHKYAEIFRHGSDTEQLMLRTVLWSRWMDATSDPTAAIWLAMVKRHSPPIVTSGNLVVTHRQLDAMFASNDWVAKAAGLPTSTPASRAAYAAALPAKFAAMPLAEKQQHVLADKRWADLLSPILDHSDLRAKAVSIVHQNVHGQADVAMQARSLENDGIAFHVEMAQFVQHMAAIGGLAYQGQMNAESLNFASRKFMGMGR